MAVAGDGVVCSARPIWTPSDVFVQVLRLARAAGLEDNRRLDLLSHRADASQREMEVNGRGGTGNVGSTENEWPKACDQRGRYWLYVVYECGTPHLRLLRVQDPFGKLVVKAKGA